MTPVEAITAVGRMLSAYPQALGDDGRAYAMTIAEVLCAFPRETATAACSPVHGVPREHRQFRPTAGQVAEWCENESAWLRRQCDDTPLYEPEPEMDRSDRPPLADVIARAAKIMGREVTRDGNIGPSKEVSEEQKQEAARRMETIKRANDKYLDAAYVSSGITISKGLVVSLKNHPSWRDPVKAKPAPDDMKAMD